MPNVLAHNKVAMLFRIVFDFESKLASRRFVELNRICPPP
jgi:hypothetical protein